MHTSTKALVLAAAASALLASGVRAADATTNTAPTTKPILKASDLFPDSIVAKGKGFDVMRSQLDEEVARVKSQYAASQSQPFPEEKSVLLQQEILDSLIRLKILVSKATDADKAAGKATAEKRIEEAKTKMGSDEAFNRQLKLAGVTREELLAKWTEGGTADATLKRELKINISDDDAKKFYDDNSSQFEAPEMVRASHILLSTKDMTTRTELSAEQKAAKHKLAEDLLKRARAGEDFAKLAKEYSEDPGSKDKGGEYTFPRGQMVAEFETAAFALKTNEVSDIVTTQFGYHIIKLSEKVPAQKTPLAKVSADIKNYLAQQEISKLGKDYFTQAKKDAGVEILDEKLKPAEVPSLGVPAEAPAASASTNKAK